MIYVTVYCTSLIKYMGNLPSCCGIISKHVYPLELPEMAPFRMKITKNNSGGGVPIPPSITILLVIIIYMHMHIKNLVVCKNKKKIPWKILSWSWHPSEPTFWPPPLSLGDFFCVCFFFVFFWFFFCFFKILLRIKINSLALVYMKINFLVELMLKIICPDKIFQPSLSLRIKWSPPKT